MEDLFNFGRNLTRTALNKVQERPDAAEPPCGMEDNAVKQHVLDFLRQWEPKSVTKRPHEQRIRKWIEERGFGKLEKKQMNRVLYDLAKDGRVVQCDPSPASDTKPSWELNQLTTTGSSAATSGNAVGGRIVQWEDKLEEKPANGTRHAVEKPKRGRDGTVHTIDWKQRLEEKLAKVHSEETPRRAWLAEKTVRFLEHGTRLGTPSKTLRAIIGNVKREWLKAPHFVDHLIEPFVEDEVAEVLWYLASKKILLASKNILAREFSNEDLSGEEILLRSRWQLRKYEQSVRESGNHSGILSQTCHSEWPGRHTTQPGRQSASNTPSRSSSCRSLEIAPPLPSSLSIEELRTRRASSRTRGASPRTRRASSRTRRASLYSGISDFSSFGSGDQGRFNTCAIHAVVQIMDRVLSLRYGVRLNKKQAVSVLTEAIPGSRRNGASVEAVLEAVQEKAETGFSFETKGSQFAYKIIIEEHPIDEFAELLEFVHECPGVPCYCSMTLSDESHAVVTDSKVPRKEVILTHTDTRRALGEELELWST